ncbi:MAG: NADH-quinone oxidoreductase subunit N [Verrucomicrobia bacterium]|nr:NADH-quinone oxidoreductase subunit N [Verrucomicrobiota bacterium]
MNPWFFPEILLTLAGVGLILADTLAPEKIRRRVPLFALLGAAGILVWSLFPASRVLPDSWLNLFVSDGLSAVFKPFFLLCLVTVIAMAARYRLGADESVRGEFLALPFFSTAGLCLLASARDFLAVFVALELVSISLYLLAAFHRAKPASLEAGIKLLVMGGLSTGFLVMGIAWLYAGAGTTEFSQLLLKQAGQGSSPAVLVAAGLILAGIGFKVAAVPFHAWAPDVYEGAPTPITAYLAVASKAAGFVLLLRVFGLGAFALESMGTSFRPVFLTLGIATVTLGTLAALTQRDLKRLLAYSGIAHAGFMILALGTRGEGGIGTVVAYLWAYLLASLPVFLFVNELERLHGSTDMRHLDGMGRREPGPSLGLTLCLVSMAGLPPLVGFPVKLAVLANLWNAGETPALVVAVAMAVAGLGIYLTPIRVMYWEREADAIPARRFPPFLIGVMLAAGLLNVGLGLQPKFLVRVAELSLNPTPVVQPTGK